MDLELALEPRATLGKQTKTLRRAGLVPGVVFGKGSESLPVQVDAKRFETLYHAAGRTSIVKLSVGSERAASGIIKSVQRHPLTGRAVHVDFFLVDLKAEMQVDIPVVLTGEAPAVEQLGGVIFQSLDHVKVRALPSDLPKEVTADLGTLIDFDAAIHVSDLVVGDAVTILNEPDELVVKMMPPRVAEEEFVAPTEEGEAAEGPATEAETAAEDENAG